MGQNIAIIAARGGSKRLPRKNILEFLGRPIIHYVIEAAQQSGLFDLVVVSTEDDEIKKCVEVTKCEVHHRSPELATDAVEVPDVVREVLNFYHEKGRVFEYMCNLYATAPMLNADDIRNSYQLMLSEGADYCTAVTKFSESPFFAYDLKENGRIKRRWPEIVSLPPLERPKVVVDNGSLYWKKVDTFIREGSVEEINCVGYFMPRERSIDIDTKDDFELVEYYAGKLKEK